MNGFNKLLALGLFVLTLSPTLAQSKELDWRDLAPETNVEIANPFEAMTPRQIDTLRTILKIEAAAEQTGNTEDLDRAATLRAELKEQGFDADALFEQRLQIIKARRAAASYINPDVLGQDVRLAGYLLPLKLRDRKAVEFLLVPTFGACIHTPPPPANQIVHVVYPEGIEVSGLYEPVWIAGKLRSEQSVQDVSYLDGSAEVDVSYMMNADDVRLYSEAE